MNTMRPVLYKKEFNSEEYTENGKFHRWGTDLYETNNSCHELTIAIIEKPDGTVINLAPNMIKFTDIDDNKSIDETVFKNAVDYLGSRSITISSTGSHLVFSGQTIKLETSMEYWYPRYLTVNTFSPKTEHVCKTVFDHLNNWMVLTKIAKLFTI